MSASAVLERLALAGVSLTPLGADKLAAEPAEALTDELRAAIRAHKHELLALLASQPNADLRSVIRLRLVLEAKSGARIEAILEVPRERYDGLRVLEAFEKHRMAGTTRVISVRQEGAIWPCDPA